MPTLCEQNHRTATCRYRGLLDERVIVFLDIRPAAKEEGAITHRPGTSPSYANAMPTRIASLMVIFSWRADLRARQGIAESGYK